MNRVTEVRACRHGLVPMGGMTYLSGAQAWIQGITVDFQLPKLHAHLMGGFALCSLMSDSRKCIVLLLISLPVLLEFVLLPGLSTPIPKTSQCLLSDWVNNPTQK